MQIIPTEFQFFEAWRLWADGRGQSVNAFV